MAAVTSDPDDSKASTHGFSPAGPGSRRFVCRLLVEIDVDDRLLADVLTDDWREHHYGHLRTAGDVADHLAFNLAQGRRLSSLDGFADQSESRVIVRSLEIEDPAVEIERSMYRETIHGCALPEEWTAEVLSGFAQQFIVICSARGNCVTLDFGKRGFRGGHATTGSLLNQTYSGTGWKQALTTGAIQWLSKREKIQDKVEGRRETARVRGRPSPGLTGAPRRNER